MHVHRLILILSIANYICLVHKLNRISCVHETRQRSHLLGLWHDHLGPRFFLFVFFTLLCELFKSPKKLNLPTLSLLRYWLWTSFEKVKCSSLMFYKRETKVRQIKLASDDSLNHKILTWDEWDLVECLPPVIRHLNNLIGSSNPFSWVSFLVCIFDKLLQILPLKCIEYIEEVFAIRYSALSHLRRKIPHELLISLQHRPKLDHSQFIVEGNMNSLDLIEFQERFLLNKNFFQKIFVEHVVRRQVKLD